MTAKEIPVRCRDGAVVATALVDEEDYEFLRQFRWHFAPNLPGGRGYAVRTTSRRDGPQRKVGMHVMVLERMGHPRGSYQIGDHVNRDPLDNRRMNLRPTTFKANAENRDQRAFGGVPGRRPGTVPQDPTTGRFVSGKGAGRLRRDAR